MEDDEVIVEQPAQEWKISTTEVPVTEQPQEEVAAPVEQDAAQEESAVINQEAVAEQAVVEIDDEKVISFLKEKGIEATTLEDLKPKPQKEYSPEVLKFAEFQEKTGRGYEDFMETQRDFTKDSPEDNIKRVMKMENPSLESKDIERLFERKYGTSGLDEEDDAETIEDRLLDRRVELQRALSVLENAKKE